MFQMPPKKANTRQSLGSCFGPACSLPDLSSLYTVRNVLAAIDMEININPTKTLRWAVQQLAPAVRAKWNQTSAKLVLTPECSVLIKMTRIYEKALLINMNRLSAKAKKIFIDKLDKIFDILVCHCLIQKCSKLDCHPAHCYDGAHITCSCPRVDKIPIKELLFIMDQREKVGLNGGQKQIGRAGKVEVRRQEKKNESKIEKIQGKATSQSSQAQISAEPVAEENNNNLETERDNDFLYKKKPKSEQNRTELAFYIAEVSRYGVSDRAAAALYNAALKTVDIINDEKTSLVVDKSKIRRARDIFSAKQKEIRINRLVEGGGLQCLGSDGKRNKKTRVKEFQMINGELKEKFSIKTREHLVYTAEPGGEYLCHSEVSKGTGRELCKDFIDVLAEHDSKESILAVVADGTNVNTGSAAKFENRPTNKKKKKNRPRME